MAVGLRQEHFFVNLPSKQCILEPGVTTLGPRSMSVFLPVLIDEHEANSQNGLRWYARSLYTPLLLEVSSFYATLLRFGLLIALYCTDAPSILQVSSIYRTPSAESIKALVA